MQIYLDGIGLIKDSTVKLDGLTVITGENNSGKSTVGKALYAIVDGMIDIDLKQERDEIFYIHRTLFSELKSILRSINNILSDNFIEEYYDEEEEEKGGYTSARSELFNGDIKNKYTSKDSLLEYDLKLKAELKMYNLTEEEQKYISYLQNITEDKALSLFKDLQAKAIGVCILIEDILSKGINKNTFRARYMNYTLRAEFNKEIQPVKTKEIISNLSFKNNITTYFTSEIKDNEITIENCKVEPHSFTKTFLIDNAFILDEVYRKPTGFIPTNMHPSTAEPHLTHKLKLITYLDEPYNPNITFELNDGKKIDKVKEKINAVLPGTFNNTPQGLEYVEDGISLRATNLATGSKMFAIIKMILDKYGLDDSTMLILDEPEAHLHPKWQNAFAEVIAILVKDLGVNVLLTSHSPNFVLAIDAFMRKYEINEKTNFYQTELQDDGFVKYKLVNDDLSVIYDDYAKYFAKVRTMRDHGFFGVEE